MAGVAFLIAFPARHAIVAALGEGPRIVADNRTAGGGLEMAQSEESEEPDVPPEQVKKYINVYKSMQKNHGLTVDEAASQQDLSVQQFRALEGKIEHDDMLREHVRQVLGKSSSPNAQ